MSPETTPRKGRGGKRPGAGRKRKAAPTIEAPAKAKTGRPLLPIDPKLVEGMAKVGATNVEIADFVGCDESVVRDRFPEILTKARSECRLRLRQTQYKLANGSPSTTRTTTAPDGTKIVEETAGFPPNPTMCVWLGKNMLGQKDQLELGGEGGGPLLVSVTHTVVDPRAS